MSPMDTPRVAEELSDLGYWPLLCHGKKPIERFAGRPPPDREELIRKLREEPRLGIAVRLPSLLACDADDDQAKDILSTFPETLTQTTPRHGQHRLYRLPEGIRYQCRTKLFGCGFDVKTGPNAYLMFSPSYSREHRRRYELQTPLVSPFDLPELDLSLLPPMEEVKPKEPSPKPRILDTSKLADRVVKYAERTGQLAPSHAGSNGHRAAFVFGCNILRAIPEMTLDHLRLAFQVFNHYCQPEWSPKELAHKEAECWRKVRGS